MQPVSEDTEKKPLRWLLHDLGRGGVIVDEREKHLEVSRVERKWNRVGMARGICKRSEHSREEQGRESWGAGGALLL